MLGQGRSQYLSFIRSNHLTFMKMQKLILILTENYSVKTRVVDAKCECGIMWGIPILEGTYDSFKCFCGEPIIAK